MKVFTGFISLFLSVLFARTQYVSQFSVDLVNSFSHNQQTLKIFANTFDLPRVIIDPSPAPLDSLTLEPCSIYGISNVGNSSFPEFYLLLSALPKKFHLVYCESDPLQFAGSCFIGDLSECLSQFLQLSDLSNYPIITIYLSQEFTPRRLASCSNNENGCKSCKSLSSCELALDGYYLTTSGEASRCKYGCQNCTDTYTCTECFQGFTLKNENCEACPGNCLKCSTTQACEICDYNFFLDLGICTPCMEGCYLCANYTSCGISSSGYSIKNDLVIKCQTGCEECEESECLSCQSSYFLTTDKICLPCLDNCVECSSVDSCSQCAGKYFLNSDQVCAECSDNCLTCSSESCSECDDYYYLKGSGECQSCSSNCDSCEVSTYCNECSGGYYRDDGECTACKQGCEDCSADSCNACASIGYYNASDVCQECDDGCKYCVNGYCTYCIEGYFLEDLNCTKCEVGCLSCLNSSFCTGCSQEFYLNKGDCVKCPEGCLQCYHTTCQDCKTGFYMKESSCVSCATGCYNCTKAKTCESCIEGYYLNDDTCQSCNTGSYYCTSETTSRACMNGYYLSSETCQICSEGCKICTSLKCLICYSGFNYNSTTQVCDPCSDDCSNCKSGFYLENSNCYSCPDGCLDCESSTSCSSCEEGFRLLSGLCQACSASCETCESGYYLNSKSQCTSCQAYCTICTSESDCSKCQDSYYLDKNTCKPCPMYCSACNSLNLCNSCVEHFYLDAYNICQACTDNCKSCSSTACQECNPTYYLNSGGECEVVKEHCLILENNKCTYCINGFTEKLGECIICESIQVTRAEFTYNFKSVEIEFSIPINITISNGLCEKCKEIARTEGNFGDKCSCETDEKVFRIIFGKDYLLTSSSTILVITEKLFKYICYNDQKGFGIQPSYNTLPKQPVPFIRYYPIQSFNCEADVVFFEVNTVYNSYGYSVTYTWFIETNPTNQLVESLALVESSRRLSIDMSLFDGVETHLTVTVKVQNMVKLQGITTVEADLQQKEFFVIELDNYSPKTIFFDNNYVLTARVADTCFSDYPRISWNIENVNINLYTTRLKHLLYLPAFGLPVKSDYYSGKVLATGFNGITGYLSFNISVVYSPLVIVLNTQNSTINPYQNFTLDASKSYNPNTNETDIKYKNLVFSWGCCISKDTAKCERNACGTEKYLEKNTDELKDYIGKYFQVTLNLSSINYPQATKDLVIFIEEKTEVNINLFADKTKYELINFGHKFESTIDLFNNNGVSLIWSIEGPKTGKYEDAGMNTPQFYVYRKSLLESEPNFKFNLKAFKDNQVVGSAYINIVKNIIPVCSDDLSVTPLVSKKSKIYTDLFVFYISDCSDTDADYPLTFRFSVRACDSDCDKEDFVWTTYYQLSVQKSFNEMKAYVFFDKFQASVQYCDNLRSCDSSTLDVIATDNKVPSNLLDNFRNSTKNKEYVPYYSVMYIKKFYSQLSSDEFTYIYNDYSLFMRKQKIVNFDVVHISLTFINEIFKLNIASITKPRHIRLYFNEALKVIKKNSDSLTQQNSDVACEIINNAMKILNDDDVGMELLNLAIEFVEKIFTLFSIDRVVGDLIVNSKASNSEAKIIKYRNTVGTLNKNLDDTVKTYLESFDFSLPDDDEIYSVIVYKLKLGGSELNSAKVFSSGTYNETVQEYIISEEKLTYVEKNSLSLVTDNEKSKQKCFTFDGTTWEKENNCKVTSNISVITVSSDHLNRVENSDYIDTNIKNTYAPLIVSFIIAFFTIIILVFMNIYEKKQLANSDRRHKKKTRLNSTSAVIKKNTLFLSVFSKDPSINTKHKVLHLFVILNIQLLIEGCFYGWSVIRGKAITVIVGTGFLIPIFTLPYNILATYNIPKDKKWMNILFVVLWISQLLISTLLVAMVNFYLTSGKNAHWIASFGVGLTCELILEIFVMVWKNLREKHTFLELEITD